MTGSDAVSFLIGRGYTPHQAHLYVSRVEAHHQPLVETDLIYQALRMGMQ